MVTKKPGFTLIELLVVIAIIALLISIIMPALRAVKQHAQSVLCGSNIRQFSIGFTVYQQENDTFPYGFKDIEPGMVEPTDRYPGDATRDKVGLWWFNYLRDSMEISRQRGSVLWCPSNNEASIDRKYNDLCGNYGVNRSICKDAHGATGNPFRGKPLRMTQIRNPSGAFLIGDSGYSLVSWQAAVDSSTPAFENLKRLDSFYVPGLTLNKNRDELWQNYDAIKGRHSGKKINAGFADGHMESIVADSLEVKTNGDGSCRIPPIWKPN
ncbi:MAG: prepilin-type N-terminal cleavage/methylation domain-containing protein [Anaerohalosphaera sp.]|nr:prepilin-type N-terminal cleavage/methylation domain-containing protein [Anaerohalosphaera sp.]